MPRAGVVSQRRRIVRQALGLAFALLLAGLPALHSVTHAEDTATHGSQSDCKLCKSLTALTVEPPSAATGVECSQRADAEAPSAALAQTHSPRHTRAPPASVA